MDAAPVPDRGVKRAEQRAFRARAVAWVERACAEQGIPIKVTDPLVLKQVADILGEARDAREAARKASRAA